jgi:hypothetical protein
MILNELAVIGQSHEDLVYHVFASSVANAHNLGYLLVIHRFEWVLAEDSQDGVDKRAEAVFIFSRHIIIFCKDNKNYEIPRFARNDKHKKE